MEPKAAVTHWQEQMPRIPVFLILFAAWVLLFQFLGNSTFGYIDTPSLFAWLSYAYETSPDDSLGYWMPLAVLGLMWYRKDELLATPKAVWWGGLGILALAAVMHLGGYMAQQARASVLAFAVGVYALMGIVWGKAFMKTTFFPMILLVFCMPLNTLAETITFPLRIVVTQISVGIGHNILGIDVFRAGSQIFDGKGTPLYDVAPACSGMRSLITMAVLTVIYGFLTFKSHWRKLVVFASALPLAVLGNVVRITTVIIVGDLFGKDAALMIETKFGFITFAVALGAVMLIGYVLREDRDKPRPPSEPPMDAEAFEEERSATA